MPTLTLPLFSAVDFVCTGAATFIVTVEHAKDTKVPTLNYTKIEGSDDVLAKTEITTTLTGPESLTIKVTAPPIAFRFFGVFGPFLELALTLTLPSDIQDFSFQGSNGKLLVESGANFSRSFDCKWESGCLKVSTPLTTESFSAATNTGTIELFGGGIRASKFLSLETKMGAIKGSTLEASGFSLATETGSIQFDSIVASATATNTTTNTSSTPQTSNDINIETNTGSVKVAFLSCTSLGITTQTGSIKISETHATQNVMLESNTGSVVMGSVKGYENLMVQVETGSVWVSLEPSCLSSKNSVQSNTGSIFTVVRGFNGSFCGKTGFGRVVVGGTKSSLDGEYKKGYAEGWVGDVNASGLFDVDSKTGRVEANFVLGSSVAPPSYNEAC